MMYIGLMVSGQIVTFGTTALVVISDTHSYTSKICTKQNLYMQDVLFYYNNQTVNVFLAHILSIFWNLQSNNFELQIN